VAGTVQRDAGQGGRDARAPRGLGVRGFPGREFVVGRKMAGARLSKQ